MKRSIFRSVLSLLLTLCLMVGLVPTAVFAEETSKNDTRAALETLAQLVAKHYDVLYAEAYRYAKENGYLDYVNEGIDAAVAHLEELAQDADVTAEEKALAVSAARSLVAAKAWLEEAEELNPETIGEFMALMEEGATAYGDLTALLVARGVLAEGETPYYRLVNDVIPNWEVYSVLARKMALALLLDRIRADLEALEIRNFDDLFALNDKLEARTLKVKNALETAIAESRAQLDALEAHLDELEAELAAKLVELEVGDEEAKAAAAAAIVVLEAAIAETRAAIDETERRMNASYAALQALQNSLLAVNTAVENLFVEGADGLVPLQKALDDVATCAVELVATIDPKSAELLAEVVAEYKAALNNLYYDGTGAYFFYDPAYGYLALGDETVAGKKTYAAGVAASIAQITGEPYTCDNSLAKAGLMIQDSYAALEENAEKIAKSDLITLGYGNNGFTNFAIAYMMAVINDNPMVLDWLEYISEEDLAKLEEMKKDIYQNLAESGVSGEYMGVDIADLMVTAVEAYAYSYAAYAFTLPKLVEEIHTLNPQALVVVVGMYNPLQNVTLDMEGNEIPIGDYLQYIVDAVNLTSLAYSMTTENLIFVDAPDVEVQNKKTTMNLLQFMNEFLFYRAQRLNPTEAGHAYIAQQIMNALTVEKNSDRVTWVSASTTLGGNIGLNFYVKLSDSLAEDENAYMRFTFDEWTVDVPVADALKVEMDGEIQYRFTCPINAKNMTDVVTAQMMTGERPVAASKSLAVVTYCNFMIQYGNDPELVSLMKAMLNYGAAAQVLFDHNVDDLANAGLSEADKQLADVDASAYAASVSGSEEGIALASASLILETETSIRIYFRLTGDKTIDAYTFFVDGKEVKPVQKGSEYYVEIADIAAQHLDITHVVTVGGITVNYSGLSYVNMVMNNQSVAGENLVNTAKALFVYNKLAEAYFN